MDYPLLDAEATELLSVAYSACTEAWPRIDDLDVSIKIERIIADLDRILRIAGNA